MWAAQNANYEVVMILFNAGANLYDINKVDYYYYHYYYIIVNYDICLLYHHHLI
jgi:hypothetical protein